MNASYINYLKANRRAQNTIDTYNRHINGMLNYIGKGEADITVADLDNWMCSISNMSPASINLKIAAVKDYFAYLVSRGYINNNPSMSLNNVKCQNKIKKYMDADMIRAMVDNVLTARDRAIILLYASSGMRVAELTSITIDQYLDMKSKGLDYIVITTKGDKKRVVHFNHQVVEAIDDYIKVREKGNVNCLFLSHKGNQIAPNHLSETLKSAARRAGIPFWNEISNHSLRAACASIMSEKNIPLAVIRDTLGHANLATTSRYVKTNEEQIRNAAMAMVF